MCRRHLQGIIGRGELYCVPKRNVLDSKLERLLCLSPALLLWPRKLVIEQLHLQQRLHWG